MKKVLVGMLMLAMSFQVMADDSVTLLNGDVLRGTIKEVTDTNLTIVHATLGDIVVTLDKVHDYTKGGVNKLVKPLDKGVLKMIEKPVEAPKPVKPKPKQFFEGWDSKLDAGLNGTSGNSRNENIYVRYLMKRATKENRYKLDANYFLATSNGAETQNEFDAGARVDWLIPESSWYYFAEGRIEVDRFEAWDQRLTVAGGVGFDWIRQDDFYVSLRAGAGFNKEFGSVDDEIVPEGLLGAELGWTINDRQSLSASTTYYPVLNDFWENRVVTEVAWEYKMSDIDRVSLKAGVTNEYESETQGAVKHSDWKYFVGISMEF